MGKINFAVKPPCCSQWSSARNWLQGKFPPPQEPQHSTKKCLPHSIFSLCVMFLCEAPPVFVFFFFLVRGGGRTRWMWGKKRVKSVFHLLLSFSNAHNSQGWADKSQGPRIPLQIQQRSRYLSHHVLPPKVCISRKLDQKQNVDLNPGTLIRSTDIPSGHFHHCTIAILLWNSFHKQPFWYHHRVTSTICIFNLITCHKN